MVLPQKPFMHSVMNYIHLSLFTIIGITLVSIFVSFWITEQASTDARAINLSGSMRMQTYHIGAGLVHAPTEVAELILQLDRTWNDPLFARVQRASSVSNLTTSFAIGYHHWFDEVRPNLLKAIDSQVTNLPLYRLLEKQVVLTNDLVMDFQLEAEAKIRNLRTFQLFALMITTLVGSFIFSLLKNRVEAPLKLLTEAAKQISEGNFEQLIQIDGKDELAQLAEAFNQMSQSISQTYNELESRVIERTEELMHNNTMLKYLFDIARKVLDNQNHTLNYQEAIQNLANILRLEELELCLFTPQGEQPYLQLDMHQSDDQLCKATSCQQCKGSGPFNSMATEPDPVGRLHHKYPIVRDDKQYGVIRVKSTKVDALQDWQEQLLQSTADQLAIALSLNDQKDQEHRLAMLSERTVIARELHDSLAQALSYLQIQVTRLQRSQDKHKYDQQQPIIDELREGLASAYRNLRELLTTFRLQMETGGLNKAFEQTVIQLKQRSGIEIELHYGIEDLPLSPAEEIHMLQIAREACQNAINHSQGSTLNISVQQLQDKTIELKVEDNGVGLSDKPEKLNHYGLAIIQERSRHLGGKLRIDSSPGQGTKVNLNFLPDYLKAASFKELSIAGLVSEPDTDKQTRPTE